MVACSKADRAPELAMHGRHMGTSVTPGLCDLRSGGDLLVSRQHACLMADGPYRYKCVCVRVCAHVYIYVCIQVSNQLSILGDCTSLAYLLYSLCVHTAHVQVSVCVFVTCILQDLCEDGALLTSQCIHASTIFLEQSGGRTDNGSPWDDCMY